MAFLRKALRSASEEDGMIDLPKGTPCPLWRRCTDRSRRHRQQCRHPKTSAPPSSRPVSVDLNGTEFGLSETSLNELSCTHLLEFVSLSEQKERFSVFHRAHGSHLRAADSPELSQISLLSSIIARTDEIALEFECSETISTVEACGLPPGCVGSKSVLFYSGLCSSPRLLPLVCEHVRLLATRVCPATTPLRLGIVSVGLDSDFLLKLVDEIRRFGGVCFSHVLFVLPENLFPSAIRRKSLRVLRRQVVDPLRLLQSSVSTIPMPTVPPSGERVAAAADRNGFRAEDGATCGGIGAPPSDVRRSRGPQGFGASPSDTTHEVDRGRTRILQEGWELNLHELGELENVLDEGTDFSAAGMERNVPPSLALDAHDRELAAIEEELDREDPPDVPFRDPDVEKELERLGHETMKWRMPDYAEDFHLLRKQYLEVISLLRRVCGPERLRRYKGGRVVLRRNGFLIKTSEQSTWEFNKTSKTMRVQTHAALAMHFLLKKRSTKEFGAGSKIAMSHIGPSKVLKIPGGGVEYIKKNGDRFVKPTGAPQAHRHPSARPQPSPQQGSSSESTARPSPTPTRTSPLASKCFPSATPSFTPRACQPSSASRTSRLFFKHRRATVANGREPRSSSQRGCRWSCACTESSQKEEKKKIECR